MSNARRTSIRNTRRQSSDHDDEDTIEFQSGSNNNLTKHKRAPRTSDIRKQDGAGSSTITNLEAAIARLKTNQQMQNKLVAASQKEAKDPLRNLDRYENIEIKPINIKPKSSITDLSQAVAKLKKDGE